MALYSSYLMTFFFFGQQFFFGTIPPKFGEPIRPCSCVFHYLGIHDAFPLAYFSFNDDLKPDFQIFGNFFILFTNNFLIKLDFRRLVINKIAPGR
jgi:hypothetical protein